MPPIPQAPSSTPRPWTSAPSSTRQHGVITKLARPPSQARVEILHVDLTRVGSIAHDSRAHVRPRAGSWPASMRSGSHC